MTMERPIARLLLERAFPREARAAMDRDLARWYLHELNGLGDLLRAADEHGGPARLERLRALRLRIEQLVQAFGAARDDLVPWVWERLSHPFEHPEDVFAPAVLLQAHAEGPRFRQWREHLLGEQREAASLLQCLDPRP